MTAPEVVVTFRALVQEHVRASLLTAYELENSEALARRVLEDPRAVAVTVLSWAADPGNEALKKLGDATLDKRGQTVAWLAAAQALREEIRYDLRTTRRSGALTVVTGNPCSSEPVFVITPPGQQINNLRTDGYGVLDPEREF